MYVTTDSLVIPQIATSSDLLSETKLLLFQRAVYVSRLGTEEGGSIPAKDVTFFLYFKGLSLALGSSQDPIQSIIIPLSSSELKWPGHEPDQSPWFRTREHVGLPQNHRYVFMATSLRKLKAKLLMTVCSNPLLGVNMSDIVLA